MVLNDKAIEVLKNKDIPLLVRILAPEGIMRAKLKSKTGELRDRIVESMQSDTGSLERIATETKNTIGEQLTRAADLADLRLR